MKHSLKNSTTKPESKLVLVKGVLPMVVLDLGKEVVAQKRRSGLRLIQGELK